MWLATQEHREMFRSRTSGVRGIMSDSGISGLLYSPGML